MPLFKSLSPSRSSLTIPIPPQNSNFATSPSSSRSQSPGEELQQLPRLGKMQDETLRNVKLVEELLRAWNEHRQALLACAKSGKRLARAMDELGQGTDKTSLISQTLRPSATALEGCAEITAKWAKKADKGYEAINTEALRYFSLLAKETRSHEAYRSGIGKRHAQAATHAALLHLQHTLIADVTKADSDHVALLQTKQSTLLLSLAAHAGALGTGLTHYHSESLRKAASGYKDIEYFRVLAESQWSGQVPDDLEERAESEAREMMRIQKARVAVGELDVVGQGVWENISARPRMGRVVTESVLLSSSTTYGRPPFASQASGLSQASNSTTRTSYFSGSGTSDNTATDTNTGSTTTSTSSATTITSPSTSKGSWGDMISPSLLHESPSRPLPIPQPAQTRLDSPRFTPGHGLRSTSVSMPTPRRSVSQIAADLEALAQPSPPDTSTSTPGSVSPSPLRLDMGSRRVTMPPVYSQPGGPLSKAGGAGGWTIPTVQPRRASMQVKMEGEAPRALLPDQGVASPTPKRSVRLSTMGMGFELGSK